jgi:hypothetical protein
MPNPPSQRSVKIGSDERTGWSSERPRRDGAPPRPVDVSTRCRVLAPSDRLRYSPGSLVVIVSSAASDPSGFAARVVEERGVVLSHANVCTLLTGRVPADQLEAKALELLDKAVVKRLDAQQSVVVAIAGLDPQERERYVRLAHSRRRPRHLILLEPPRNSATEDEQAPLNALRRAIETGEVGSEGFQTALRLGGESVTELKRIVFAPAPVD